MELDLPGSIASKSYVHMVGTKSTKKNGRHLQTATACSAGGTTSASP
jgi:hypothetical protein